MPKKHNSVSDEDSYQDLHAKLNKIIDSLEEQDKRITAMENALVSNMNLKKELDTVKADLIQTKNAMKDIRTEQRKNAMNKNRKSIEIAGVPRTANESLPQIASIIGELTTVDITSSDIKDIFRKKDTTNGPGAIIMKLHRVEKRNQLLQKAKGRKISTTDLKISGTSRNVYLNVPLLPETKNILYQVKQLSTVRGWFRVWIYGATVHIRMEEGGAPIKIETLEDLGNLIR